MLSIVLTMFNANAVLELNIVLKMIPNDSPQFSMQNVLSATTENISIDRCRFTTMAARMENRRHARTSKGSSKVEYARKNDSTE
jgi:hypothetical protein